MRRGGSLSVHCYCSLCISELIKWYIIYQLVTHLKFEPNVATKTYTSVYNYNYDFPGFFIIKGENTKCLKTKIWDYLFIMNIWMKSVFEDIKDIFLSYYESGIVWLTGDLTISYQFFNSRNSQNKLLVFLNLSPFCVSYQ